MNSRTRKICTSLLPTISECLLLGLSHVLVSLFECTPPGCVNHNAITIVACFHHCISLLCFSINQILSSISLLLRRNDRSTTLVACCLLFSVPLPTAQIVGLPFGPYSLVYCLDCLQLFLVSCLIAFLGSYVQLPLPAGVSSLHVIQFLVKLELLSGGISSSGVSRCNLLWCTLQSIAHRCRRLALVGGC